MIERVLPIKSAITIMAAVTGVFITTSLLRDREVTSSERAKPGLGCTVNAAAAAPAKPVLRFFAGECARRVVRRKLRSNSSRRIC
jgi:hypothetical protein